MSQIFDDPFLFEKLNPIFLQELQKYWGIVSDAKHEEPQKILKVQQNLVIFLFRRLFRNLYLNYLPKDVGRIFLLTSVRPDGIGDYFATLKSAKVIKLAYTEADVEFAFIHQLPLPAIEPKDYLLTQNDIHDFLETVDRPILEPVLEGQECLPFEIKLVELSQERQQLFLDIQEIVKNHGYAVPTLTEMIGDIDRQIKHLDQFTSVKNRALRIYESLKKSQAIVHISLPINTFENPLFAPKSLYFSEAGNFQGIANCIHLNWFSMGLGAFEEGIFLKRTFESRPIQNQNQEKSVYVGYLPKISQQRLVFTYLICLMKKKDIRPIEILLPQFDKNELQNLDPHWVSQQGISAAVLVDKNGTEQLLFNTEITEGKILRLVQAFPLTPSEFENVLSLSGEVVGCTGDGSLSDCLIAGKIPYYEHRPHKIETWQGFQTLAKYLELDTVSKYLLTQEQYKDKKAEAAAEDIWNVIKEERFKVQWERLRDFIFAHCCFENSLVSHLTRHLLLSQNSALTAFEEKLMHDYFIGRISFSQAYHNLEIELQNL